MDLGFDLEDFSELPGWRYRQSPSGFSTELFGRGLRWMAGSR
jgi:hypothetical protein